MKNQFLHSQTRENNNVAKQNSLYYGDRMAPAKQYNSIQSSQYNIALVHLSILIAFICNGRLI